MSLQKAEQQPVVQQPAAIDLELQNRQLQLQILQLTAANEALEARVAKQKEAIRMGGEKIAVLLKANEEFARVNQSFETSFSADSPAPKKASSSERQEEQQANRDRHSSKALRARKGACPKVVEENALTTVVAGVVAVAGAVVAYKKFF